MPFLAVKEETMRALSLLKRKGETDDDLVRRILEDARCYMMIQGAEGSDVRMVRDFVLSRRSDIEKDVENFGVLKPVLNYFLKEVEAK